MGRLDVESVSGHPSEEEVVVAILEEEEAAMMMHSPE